MYCIIVLIIELLICTILKMLGIDPISDFLAIFFIFLFTIAYSVDLDECEKLTVFRKPLMAGYLLRIALLLFDRYGQNIYHLPNSGADSEVFYNTAALQAQGILPSRSGGAGFIVLFRMLFRMIGINRVIAQFIVMLFSIVALCVVAFTIDELDISNKQKIRSFSVLSLLPNFAILSSIFLRESIVMMFITISFYFYVQYYFGKSYINIVFCFISIIISMLFHSGTVGFIIGYVIVLILDNRKEGIEYKRVFNLVVAVIFGFISIYLYTRYGELFFQKFLGVDNLSDIANTLEAGGSSYARYVGNSDTIGNMLLYTCPRFLFFLFPWQWRGISDIIAFVFSGMYYIVVVFLSVRYILLKESKNRNLAITTMIILTCAVFVFAWGVSNTGTAIRHRDKMICVFAVLHAICLNPERIVNITAGDRILI